MMRVNSIQEEPHRAWLGYANSAVDPCQDLRQYARNCLVGLRPNLSTPSEPPQVSNPHRQKRTTLARRRRHSDSLWRRALAALYSACWLLSWDVNSTNVFAGKSLRQAA
jgi:hypothetical protein